MFLTQKLRFSGILVFWSCLFIGFQKHNKNVHSMSAAGFVMSSVLERWRGIHLDESIRQGPEIVNCFV